MNFGLIEIFHRLKLKLFSVCAYMNLEIRGLLDKIYTRASFPKSHAHVNDLWQLVLSTAV